MTVEQNKTLIETYFQTIWNEGRFAEEPRFVDEHVVVHAPPIPGIPDGIAGPLAIVALRERRRSRGNGYARRPSSADQPRVALIQGLIEQAGLVGIELLARALEPDPA